MRGSVKRRHPLLGPPDVGFRAQHLEDHHRLIDVRGDRGAVRDVIGGEPLRDVALGARDDQLALARPQRAGGFDDALEDEVGDPDGGLEVEDQPANAALRERRRCGG